MFHNRENNNKKKKRNHSQLRNCKIKRNMLLLKLNKLNLNKLKFQKRKKIPWKNRNPKEKQQEIKLLWNKKMRKKLKRKKKQLKNPLNQLNNSKLMFQKLRRLKKN